MDKWREAPKIKQKLSIFHLCKGKKLRSLKIRFQQCILYFPPVLYSTCQSGHRTKLLFSHADTPKKHVLCYKTVFSNLQVLMSQGFRAKLPTGLHIGSAPWTMAQLVQVALKPPWWYFQGIWHLRDQQNGVYYLLVSLSHTEQLKSKQFNKEFLHFLRSITK